MNERNSSRLEPIEQSENSVLQRTLHRRALLRGVLEIGMVNTVGGGVIGEGVVLGSEEIKRPKAERSTRILGESATSIIFGAAAMIFTSINGRRSIKDAMDGLEAAARQDERKKK